VKTSAPSKNFETGFALLSLLACLLIILIVFAAVLVWVTSNAKQMQRNQQFTASEAAAEGASEIIFAHMDRDYLYGSLNSLANYENLSPVMAGWPVQYTFDENITLGPQVTNALQSLGSQYAGLLGEPQTNTITVTANPESQLYNVPATVSQTFVFAIIPAFQFAIFYNIDLEIDPGATMPIQGAVFSNGSIWSGTANVTYSSSSTVEAAGQVNISGTDPFLSGKTDSGTPLGNFQYPGPPAQPESNVNPLLLPIGASSGTNSDSSTNVLAIIQVPPASVAAPASVAYETTNQVYDFNAATLVVSNWSWGVSGGAPWSNDFTVYLQDPVTAPNAVPANWVMLTNDFYLVTNLTTHTSYTTTNVPNFQFVNNVSSIKWINPPTTFGTVGTNQVFHAGFSFLKDVSYYDYREQATVQAVQVDIGKLGAWLTNAAVNGGSNWNQEICTDTGHGINSIYVDNTVPFIGQQQLPAVRVTDGQLLPYSTCNVPGEGTIFTRGFTVVTPQPMYVMGNYNVQTNGGPVALGTANVNNTFPAAFLADSITILSSNWNDSAYTSSYPIGSRTPLPTTVNAACLEGIVPSSGTAYSGGVENFLRMEEGWSASIPLTYNGSIMVMFDSQFATNVWPGTGSVYNPPKRVWGFDTNFLIEADLPPLTPNFRAVVRNTWEGY
jgi:hypothetical protein